MSLPKEEIAKMLLECNKYFDGKPLQVTNLKDSQSEIESLCEREQNHYEIIAEYNRKLFAAESKITELESKLATLNPKK